jgi:8-oxo-dGTP diphosphatase
MKFIKVCAALIFNGDKVLLTSRSGHQEHAGYWEFPGGKIEPGETSAQCLVRELKEELNIDVTVFDTVYVLDHKYPGKHVSLQFMRCIIKNNQKPQALEKQEYAWVKRGKLNDYPLLPADKPVAEFISHCC